MAEAQAAKRASSAPAPGKIARGSVGQFDTSVAAGPPEGYTPRLKILYNDEIRQKLTEEFGYRNAMAVPKDREDRSEHGCR